MKKRVTISFVEKSDETVEAAREFFELFFRHNAPMWCDVDGEINVSVTALPSDEERERYLSIVRAHYGEAGVEPVAASSDEERGYSTVADLRRHYGCDDGGAQ